MDFRGQPDGDSGESTVGGDRVEHHVGRLIDHLHLRTADREASRRFYRAALQALGRDFTGESESHFSSDELWVDRADGPVSRVHLAFQAGSRAAVDAFHRASLAAGGRDNGAPGLRPHYHSTYYGAFVLDPDGHNIEAVCHLPDASA